MERHRSRSTVSAAVAAVICLAAGGGAGWVMGRGAKVTPDLPAMARPAPGAPAAATTALAAPPVTRPATRPASLRALDKPLAERAVLISVDGLRPDLLLRAKAPTLHGLVPAAAFTFWAQTVDHPHVYTLPSHVTMLTGVHPDRHGVTWNDYIEWHPNVPTLFERAKAGTAAGTRLTTSMVTGKMKFVALAKPGTIDWAYVPPDEPVDDIHVARQAVRILRAHRPDVLFVHLPGVDTAGHEFGWGSPEQVAALEQADAAAGEVLAALRDLGLDGSTLLIVTADHGGAGLTHWGDDPRSRTIPWIARGPGVRRGYDLTRFAALDVRTEDTFATVCVALGIPLPPDTDGRFVREMLQPPPGLELMREKQ